MLFQRRSNVGSMVVYIHAMQFCSISLIQECVDQRHKCQSTQDVTKSICGIAINLFWWWKKVYSQSLRLFALRFWSALGYTLHHLIQLHSILSTHNLESRHWTSNNVCICRSGVNFGVNSFDWQKLLFVVFVFMLKP